jgi:lycopene cyclase domain-containing protein
MTYSDFHLWFSLPVLMLSFLLARPLLLKLEAPARWAAGLNAAMAVLYTTPWDNYLVYKGIWFYGSDRVIGTIGYVPIEEYLFFIFQSLSASWFILWWWGNTFVNQPENSLSPGEKNLRKSDQNSRKYGTIFYAFWFVVGIACLMNEKSLYLGLILTWATPVLAAQWWLIGDHLVKDRTRLLTGLGFMTIYLWIADRFAIQEGIWSLSKTYTLNVMLWNLPVEEAMFFLVTNLLLVQGVVLFVNPLAHQRMRDLLKKMAHPRPNHKSS